MSRDFANDPRFDQMLLSVIDQNQGIDGYFDAVFGLLARKSDFFTKEQEAFQKVNQTMMKHAKLFKENKQAQDAINKKNAEMQAKAKAERERLAAEKAEKEEPKVVELDDEAYQKELKEAAERAGVKPPEESKEPATEEEKKDEPEEEKGMKPNAGNGGQHENYHWEQTLSEVTVYYYLPDGCTSKDLKIDMGIKKCKISIKGQVVLEKEWHKNIKQDDSLWCIETGKGGKKELQL